MDQVHLRLTTRIQTLCEKRGWSGNQLADFAGISRGSWTKVVRGVVSPTVRTLVKVADALEVEVAELFR